MFLLAQLPSLHSGAHSFLPDQNLTSESDQSSVDCCKMPSLQLLNCWTCLIINVESTIHTRDAVPQAEVCVRACVCVCVCVCALRGALQNRQAKYTLSFGRVQTIKYTHTICKTDGLESIHLKHSYILK